MIINVTQKHIDMGQKCDCLNCPVALALRETFNKRIAVTGVQAYLYTGIGSIERAIELPIEALNFIERFDTPGYKVYPFSFEIKG